MMETLLPKKKNRDSANLQDSSLSDTVIILISPEASRCAFVSFPLVWRFL